MSDIIQTSDQPQTNDNSLSWLDRPASLLLRWDWEKIAWLGLLIVVIISRFSDLGARSMSHDESEHAWFAYNLYAGKGYQHSPVYHGPFAYHLLALFFLIFGDSTVMARVPTALFGLGAVLLIWPMRRWLGKLGAFLAATLMTISPALLHYSRHTRHDMFEIFWALLLIYAVFRYIEMQAGGGRWLVVAGAALSFMLAIKEVSFIYGAAVGGFVGLLIVFRWLARRTEKSADGGIGEAKNPLSLPGGREAPARLAERDWLMLAAVIVLSFLGMLIFRLLGLGASYDTGGAAGVSNTLLRLVIIGLPPLAAIGLALGHLRQREAADTPPLLFSRPTDVALLLGTLILPWLSAFIISGLGYDPLNYNFPDGVMPSLSVAVGLAGLAIAIGLLWNARLWLIAAGVFYAIFVFLFTTFLTNGQGIATGLVGSLGYWLSQQGVARGSQPWYYYLIVTPLYEFLPIILSAPVLLAAIFKRRRDQLLLLLVFVLLFAGLLLTRSALGPTISVPSLLRSLNRVFMFLSIVAILIAAGWGALRTWPDRPFLAFLPVWILINWLGYTVAGEKMPWLVTHISLPMCIAGGWWLSRVIERVDWAAARQRGGGWIALLVIPLLAALAALLSSRPFQNRSISGLSETTQWLAALLIAGIAIWLLARQARRLGWGQAARVFGLTIVLLLGLWTLRTSYMLSFINYDMVSEFLFYAHASPDPHRVMDQIETLSERIAGDKQLKVAYDDDASWPLNWYMRDWPNVVYYGSSPSRDQLLDSPVVIAGDKNVDKVRPYVQRDYYEFRYRLVWWPDEDYKNFSWERVRQGIVDPAKRKEFLNVVLWRKYPQTMAEWPLMHRFSLFVRKDVATQLWDFGAAPVAVAAVEDPYEGGFRELSSLYQIGGQGAGAGQLNLPRNVAVGRDGFVYVADSGNHRIQAFAPDGSFLREWGSSCQLLTDGQPGCVDPDGAGPLNLGDGQFQEPWGIAVGPDNTVYVADTWNHRIAAFDSEGGFIRAWGEFGTTNGEAVGAARQFWGPRAVAVDGAGNVYVSDTGNKRVQVFTPEGGFLGQFGGGGVVEGSLDEPVGLALAPLDDGQPGGVLYVADTWNLRVQTFDVSFDEGLPSFEYRGQWPIEGWASQSVVNKPYLAVDPERDRVYVTDPEGWRVLVFDLAGEFVATFGVYGNDAQSMALPTGIAVDRAGNVYVADTDNNRVMVFPPVE